MQMIRLDDLAYGVDIRYSSPTFVPGSPRAVSPYGRRYENRFEVTRRGIYHTLKRFRRQDSIADVMLGEKSDAADRILICDAIQRREQALADHVKHRL